MASKPARSLSHRLLALDDLKTGLSDAFNRLKRKGDGEPEKLFLESAEKDKRICIYVVSDEKKTIRGMATLAVEPKYIHECSAVGHILNIWARDKEYLGSVIDYIVPKIVKAAKDMGCYKCLIDSDAQHVNLYEKVFFKKKDLQMAISLTEDHCKKTDMPSPLLARKLQKTDYSKDFIGLLSQLTTVGDITQKMFEDRFTLIQKRETQTTLVIENTDKKKIVATASLVVLFHISIGLVGHIEDVVVDSKTRGKGLGRKIMSAVLAYARASGCEECILNCSEKNSKFYAKCGFLKSKVGMGQYLHK
ncbi:hypothetical protein AAMO2058_000314300 [Amorphochlora amoebiformis]